MIGQKFATPKVDFWCSPPNNSSFEKWNTSQWRSFSSPRVHSKNENNLLTDRCQIYDVPYNNKLYNEVSGIKTPFLFILAKISFI